MFVNMFGLEFFNVLFGVYTSNRASRKMGHGQDFLTVGCMGHALSIALGVALNKPDRHVSHIPHGHSVALGIALNKLDSKSHS